MRRFKSCTELIPEKLQLALSMKGKLVLLIISCLSISFFAEAQDKQIVVAKDGTGDYLTVQEAINAVPDFRKVTTTIFIRNGIYQEKLNLSPSKKLVKLVGEDVSKTILTYNDYAAKKNRFGEEMGTSGSSGFYICGDGFTAHNITFENSSGPVGQAVALWVSSDQTAFFNCRIKGFQDTLYTYGAGNRQYFKNCYIEGTVDFIFGAATALFEDCTIFCKQGARYITASSAPDTIKYGYVFLDCQITGDALERTVYLGRPWRPYSKTVYINCSLSKLIKSEGWDNWRKASNEKTAYYAEYKNKGEGFNPEKRVAWSHQLSDDEVKNYTTTSIFKGWNPKTTLAETGKYINYEH